MTTNKKGGKTSAGNIWVISKGIHTFLDLDAMRRISTGPIKEYSISDLARYLLNPNPVEIEKKLVGCEIRYLQPSSNKIKEKIRRILPKTFHGILKDKDTPPEVLMSHLGISMPALKDRDLESHINKINEYLKPYDPVLERLLKLDATKIYDTVGICEDIGGNSSMLNLQGSIEEKIRYLYNFMLQDVRVLLEKAYISDGLFELRGFDFESYDPKNTHRLIKLYKDGERPRYCVLTPNGEIDYWVNDSNLVNYMHLLDLSIKTNTKLNDAFNLCLKGKAKPLRLFFNKQLEIDYSEGNLPKLYKEVFDAYNMGLKERNIVMNSLSNLQFVISFNYVPQSNSGVQKLFTNISVMHDLRALEPIKANLPQLYSEINKRVTVSEAGKYYLLDSIRGYKNV